MAFDLTAGTRDISLSLFGVALPGSRVYLCPTDFDESAKSYIPFSERLFGREVEPSGREIE